MNYVYIVQCADDSYYTGWTTDVMRRIQAHNTGKHGAKYTRSRRPVKLVYTECHPDKHSALCREAQIKKLSRAQKQALISQNHLCETESPVC